MLASLSLAVAGLWVASPALGAASLGWSAPQPFDGSGQAPRALSCPSESLCVVADGAGDLFRTTDPLGGAPGLVATEPVALASVSCASASLCVAVGGHDAFTSRNGALTWSPGVSVESEGTLSGVACPSESLCVAVDESGRVLFSGDPEAANWPSQKVSSGALRAVACAGAGSCVAVGASGAAFGSESPAGGTWSERPVDAGSLTAVSCAPLGALCVAVDAAGDALASADPSTPGATWSSTPIDVGGHPQAVSCAASGLCVVVDERGIALASDSAASALPSWSAPEAADPSSRLTGVSCLPGGACLAVDAAGRFLTARVPAPEAATLPPSEAAETTAVLSGSVDPHDGSLGACAFEFGPTEAYGQSVPCASLPGAAGGPQLVSATVGGLAPNTAYHYRLVVSDLAGASVGADQRFLTAVSSQVAIVVPHPSIHGTPAVGSHLSCQSGTVAGAAQLSYAWLRDLVPIPHASSSTYAVAGTDSGHHLQCQVTASDAGGTATARSAFVTVPVEGVVAAAGETLVGAARYHADSLRVPLLCSPQAFSGCRIALRLRASSGNATLASTHVRMSRGQHRTLSLALNSLGRHLVSERHRAGAQLTVTGTVIGILEALLSRQRVTLP